ncbi:MAG: NERD domain-containing protein [Tenericutes bacterium]|nr:NERD domain-containing protein [Mycoplasmatota bacterium]
MEYFIITVIILILLYAFFLSRPSSKGKMLENRIYQTTKTLAKRFGGIEMRDLMFKDSISTAQIDNLLLTSKALYVIEAKNYNGHIFGSEKQEKWTMTVKHVNRKKSRSGKIYTKTYISKYSFYNPIKQNQTHINKIIRLMNIDKNMPIINIVVFGYNAYLRDVSHSEKVFVINSNKLEELIIEHEYMLSYELDLETMISYVDDLIYFDITDKKERRDHISRIKNKYGN